jgi:hypothetical protein
VPKPDGDGAVEIDDVSFAASRFGTETGGAKYTPRVELASQNGIVQIDDIEAFASRFGAGCTSG